MIKEEMQIASASDRHQLNVLVTAPEKPVAGIVLLQEIFGVNEQMRSFARWYAEHGYYVVTPSLFDRIERGIELGYTQADLLKAMSLKGKADWNEAFYDIAAARALIPQGLRVAIVGYCWGGTLAFRSTKHVEADAVVAYYGGQIAQFIDEAPQMPLLLHFGDADTSIPLEDVERIMAALPTAESHLYPGGHGFACNARASFVADSARDADGRTLAFLKKNVG